jgi:hypothetical protein
MDHPDQVAVSEVRGGLTLDHQLTAGHLQLDLDPYGIALPVMPMGLVDDHAATDDPIAEPRQPGDRIVDRRLDGVGMGQIVE